MRFEDLSFIQVLEIVDSYHRLAKSVDKTFTQWEIAEFIDDEHEFKELILAEWSDYAYHEYGSDIDRANIKALAENFGHIVNIEDFDNHGKAWIDIGDFTRFENFGEFEDNLGYLIDIMDGLNDYPLMDEQIHSDMQMEDAIKAWDVYLAADITIELKNVFQGDAQSWFDKNEEKFKKYYYEFGDNWWTYETPTNIINGNHSNAFAYAFQMTMGW